MTEAARRAPSSLPRHEIAVAVILHAGRVLVTRRADAGHLGGFDEFPGGKRERPETLEACAIREVREEVGLSVRIVRRLAEARHDDAQGRLALTFFQCALVDPGAIDGDPPVLAADVVARQQARWVAPGELARLRFPPANAEVIGKIARGLASARAVPGSDP